MARHSGHFDQDCREHSQGDLNEPIITIITTFFHNIHNIIKICDFQANAVSCGRVYRQWTASMDKYVSPDQLYEFNSGLSVLIDATILANGVPLIYSSSTANLVPLRRLITFRLLKNALY